MSLSSQHGTEKTSLRTCDAFFDRICCINLKRRPDRWRNMLERTHHVLGDRGRFVWEAMERVEAVDGSSLAGKSLHQISSLCCTEWDATNNARWDHNFLPPYKKKMTGGEIGCVLSHVGLWQQLASDPQGDANMLILEDDVVFYPGKPNEKGFVEAFSSFVDLLPPDWDMVYLGFCNFGPRKNALECCPSTSTNGTDTDTFPLQIFRPTYGFYTHAYALTELAASRLLEQLPVAAPLDVWLADNDWFDLNVYVAVVPSPDGLKGKGVSMIAQRRVDSDIVHSAHH